MPTEFDGAPRRLALQLEIPAVRHAALVLGVILMVNLYGLGATPQAVGLIPSPWDKLAHLITFGLLAGLLTVGLGVRRYRFALALTIVAGMADEGVQWFEPGRSADWIDLLADVVAACVVAGIAWCWLKKSSVTPQG